MLAKTITVYTLRVEASTAERIAALQASSGVISLVLRAPGDTRPALIRALRLARRKERKRPPRWHGNIPL